MILVNFDPFITVTGELSARKTDLGCARASLNASP